MTVLHKVEPTCQSTSTVCGAEFFALQEIGSGESVGSAKSLKEFNVVAPALLSHQNIFNLAQMAQSGYRNLQDIDRSNPDGLRPTPLKL